MHWRTESITPPVGWMGEPRTAGGLGHACTHTWPCNCELQNGGKLYYFETS